MDVIKHRPVLIPTLLITMMVLTACSKQNWYQGAQSAQTAQCLKEPDSEFNDCNQPSKESYEDYEEKREQLILENSPQ